MVAKRSTTTRYRLWLLWGAVVILLLEAATVAWSGAWPGLLIITIGLACWLVCAEKGRCIAAWAYHDLGFVLIIAGVLVLLVVESRLALERAPLLWPLLLAAVAMLKR